MGQDTEVWGELRLPGGQVLSARRIDIGRQPTGRHFHYQPEGLPRVYGEFRLWARNVAGTSALTAPWPIPSKGG
jgi:hypothetical protein